MKIARLYGMESSRRKWEDKPIGAVRFHSRDWPDVILWNGRAFSKATTGMEEEWYREVTILNARVVETLP